MSKRGIPSHRKRLGDVIRSHRASLKLSQEQLAERLGCHRNYVGYVERGEQNVTIDVLVRFSKALGSSLEQIMRTSKM